jgi:hypothetical protein
MNRTQKRIIYSDNFLQEVKEILNLPSDFRYTERTMETTVNGTNEIWNKLKESCNKNIELRKQYNIENSNSKLNEEWCYDVLKTYFYIQENDIENDK